MSATIDLQDGCPSGPSTVTARTVEFACPLCGDDRYGVHVDGAEGSWVECDTCAYRSHPDVLEIPTEATLATWHAQGLRHGREAVRCADGTPACSYLAIVWCRRLAPELSAWGKVSFLDTVARPIVTSPTGRATREQREVLLQLGIALLMPAEAINAVLAAI